MKGMRAALRVIGVAAAIAATSIVFAAGASATMIERVTSGGGIEAWLVHERAVPLIAVEFAFAGGAVQDSNAHRPGWYVHTLVIARTGIDHINLDLGNGIAHGNVQPGLILLRSENRHVLFHQAYRGTANNQKDGHGYHQFNQ